MQTVIHTSDSRGHVKHGWLESWHTFSFADYHNSQRMNFGALRVLNDDIIAPDQGFGFHPHSNMEIVTIPITGSLRHKDSMNNEAVITSNEVQIMSAGTGVVHSEFNASRGEEVNLLQIWVLPKKMNITPRYDQKVFDPALRKNEFFTVVSSERTDESVWINQDAQFALADIEANKELSYRIQNDRGVYFFVISGQISIVNNNLKSRDAMGIWDTKESFIINASEYSEVLAIEVPMNIT